MARLYAIADAQVLAARKVRLDDFARGLRDAKVGFVQYRDKKGSPQEVLRAAALLRTILSGDDTPPPADDARAADIARPRPLLFLNDRPDLAVLARFDGVHVGQTDLAPADAKRVVGPDGMVGVSTHTDDQVRAADLTCADYIAIGPVFATGTKADAEQVVGLEGVRRARALTRKPLVAIGGITRANALSVVEAGADSVAVISGLFADDRSTEQVARDFLELLG